jgi:hypothetical protein
VLGGYDHQSILELLPLRFTHLFESILFEQILLLVDNAFRYANYVYLPYTEDNKEHLLSYSAPKFHNCDSNKVKM